MTSVDSIFFYSFHQRKEYTYLCIASDIAFTVQTGKLRICAKMVKTWHFIYFFGVLGCLDLVFASAPLPHRKVDKARLHNMAS